MSCSAHTIRTTDRSPSVRAAGAARAALEAVARAGWAVQLALFGAVYGAYMLARWVLIADTDTAVANAARIVDLERALAIGVEDAVQAALGAGAVGTALAVVYLLAQPLVIPAALVWVYRRDRVVYRLFRDTVLAAWLLALPIYALLPTAPPRLAGLGISDTVSSLTPVELQAPSSTAFFNPYAAVPSLHAGFAVAVGVAVALTLRRRPLRVAALAWGPLVILSTFATGNHFVLDAVAGVVVTLAGLGAAVVMERRRRGLEVVPGRLRGRVAEPA